MCDALTFDFSRARRPQNAAHRRQQSHSAVVSPMILQKEQVNKLCSTVVGTSIRLTGQLGS
jgi:hypothetical protein